MESVLRQFDADVRKVVKVWIRTNYEQLKTGYTNMNTRPPW